MENRLCCNQYPDYHITAAFCRNSGNITAVPFKNSGGYSVRMRARRQLIVHRIWIRLKNVKRNGPRERHVIILLPESLVLGRTRSSPTLVLTMEGRSLFSTGNDSIYLDRSLQKNRVIWDDISMY